GVLLIFVDQASAYRLWQWANLQVWLGPRFGLVWSVRVGLVLLFGLLVGRGLAAQSRAGLRGGLWWLGLGMTAVLALSSALISHSAALPRDAARGVAIDLAHVLAAGVWAGGLLQLALLAWQSRRLPAENRLWLNLSLVLNFSALGAGAVGALLLSGGYLAWQHVGTWTALVGTAYGRMLLAKIGLALLALAIAGVNLLLVKPRLQRAYDTDDEVTTEPAALARFRRLVQAEALLALLVLAAAGVLTDLQRGVDAPLLADAPGRTVVEQAAGDVDVTLTIAPALVGANTFEVYLEDANGSPIADASEVALRYTFLGRSLGAAEGIAQPVGGGRYVLDGSYISLIGTWQVEVAIRQPGVFDTFAPFRLEAGLGGNIRGVASGKRPLEAFAGFMQIAGGGATGAFLVLFALGWGVVSVKATRRTWELLLLMGVSLFTFWLGGNQMFNYFTIEYTPAKFATNPILPDAESIAIGQALFTANCAVCHGALGRGDGPGAAALPAAPANFAAGHTATHSDGDLYYWILEGIADTPMPAFGEELTEEEAWHLVNYVRRLSVAVEAGGTPAVPGG
ncbi:MAG: CopD family protein, partial [Anaerolineales bacterium]|nr:CopD family protein [Anaerolineales bacterium]